MKKLIRPTPPARLHQNYKQWGKEYETNRSWSWRQGIDQEIRPVLLQMTDDHCAFCDHYPWKIVNYEPQIGHFKPKTISPLLAYAWHNLFPVCGECNKCQGDRFYKLNGSKKIKPLKPDQNNYDFLTYFFYDPESGEIKINDFALPLEKIRAEHTLELFGLNQEKRPTLRKRAIKSFLRELTGAKVENSDFSDLLPEHRPFGFFIQMVIEAIN